MNVVVFCWESGLCWDSGSPRTVSISSARVSYFSETGVGRTRSSLILARRAFTSTSTCHIFLAAFHSRFENISRSIVYFVRSREKYKFIGNYDVSPGSIRIVVALMIFTVIVLRALYICMYFIKP